MKFQIAFATLLSFVAAATAAAAVDEVPYVIETHDLGADGTLTVYGINAVNGGEKPTLQARQCGNSAVNCSSSNTATRAVCATLINLVCNGNDSLSHDPRSICLTQSGAQCCISWSTDVGAFTESALCPSAQATFNSCTGGTVSGFQPNTPLNGGCVTQCLSNRPNGCG